MGGKAVPETAGRRPCALGWRQGTFVGGAAPGPGEGLAACGDGRRLPWARLSCGSAVKTGQVLGAAVKLGLLGGAGGLGDRTAEHPDGWNRRGCAQSCAHMDRCLVNGRFPFPPWDAECRFPAGFIPFRPVEFPCDLFLPVKLPIEFWTL